MGAVALLVTGLVLIVGMRLVRPYVQDWRQRQSSDARSTKGKIRIGIDNWVGYVPLCSTEMKKTLRRAGWLLQCQDDQANYDQRMRRLSQGELDFAVATVDSYLLNGAAHAFPGVVVAVLDESKGGDAIVAHQDRVPNLEAVKGRADLRIALTPNSPSHHLAKAAADHFDAPELLPSDQRRLATDGSEAALKRLLDGEADVAVLWEPDVSKALANPEIVKLLGTEDTAHLIVDILLVNRDFSQAQPETVELLLSAYFKVLKQYRDTPETLRRELTRATQLGDSAVQAMLGGVAWVNLTDNCQRWFGVQALPNRADEGLIDTIEATQRILAHHGAALALPDDDPYRLLRSEFVADLCDAGGFQLAKGSDRPIRNALEAPFSALDDQGWQSLREVGSLKIAPVVFQSGSDVLNLLEKHKLDAAVNRLKHYPNFRIVVKGHTGLRGDPQANQRLSQDRAESVTRYLTTTHAIHPHRMRPEGWGSTAPLARLAGESNRAYQARLPRVELLLVADVY